MSGIFIVECFEWGYWMDFLVDFGYFIVVLVGLVEVLGIDCSIMFEGKDDVMVVLFFEEEVV